MSGRNRRGGGDGHGGGGEERWLLPYADMITLLLGLFIVLFAMSSVDAKKFDNLSRSLSQTFKGDVLEGSGGVLEGTNGPGDPVNANAIPDKTVVTEMIQATNATARRFADQQRSLNGIAKETNLGKGRNVEVSQSPNGSIVLRVAGDALFEPGSAMLKPDVRKDLVRIERELSGFGAKIEIGGHTDGQPIQGGNMALSVARATSVYDLFVAEGFRGFMKVGGFADQQPLVVPAHPTDEVSRNRRIEITVLAPGADDPRPGPVKLVESVKAMQRAIRPPAVDAAPISRELQQEVDADIVGELASTSRELR